jgi:putative DNA methylase
VKNKPIDYRFLPKGLKSDLGWYDRGYIPHFEGGSIAQFFTFRLGDSLPQKVLDQWRQAMAARADGEIWFRKNVEKYLDSGYGACFLRDPRVARIVEEALLFHNGGKYDLSSWVIMPNHVHFLAVPAESVELAEIAHSIKSFTAHEANKVLDRSGQFWQHEAFDRYIRNRRHYVNVIRYIEQNPVKAGLCTRAEDWEFSSARRRLAQVSG